MKKHMGRKALIVESKLICSVEYCVRKDVYVFGYIQGAFCH